MPTLYLASASPRRSELLAQIGVPFTVLASNVDESVLPDEAPQQYVERLARAKAQAGLALPGRAVDGCVLGADTCVVLDGLILGKPADQHEAQQMLQALSGREHQVLTAVALATANSCESRLVTSRVSFREISAAEIQAYWHTGEPQDKAGGYAIQGLAAIFVRQLHGSYSAVVGLPLCETAELLATYNIPCWQLRDNPWANI